MTEPRRLVPIPAWVPPNERTQIDLSELADPDACLHEECGRLEALLDAYVAAYRVGAQARPTGLCAVFKPAPLSERQRAALVASERRFSNAVFVAYARPLARW